MSDVDLIKFLYARLDEEETAAKLVQRPYRLYIDDEGVMAEPAKYKQGAEGSDILRNQNDAWMLLYDPDKVLQEIAVKRKFVDRFRRSALLRSRSGGEQVGEKWYSVMAKNLVDLAAVYKDHPDYRPKWIED
jgi:hypothetical protein